MGDWYTVFRELWVLWLMAIFLGIVAWALWPTRKRQEQMEHHRNIPLRDDEDDADETSDRVRDKT